MGDPAAQGVRVRQALLVGDPVAKGGAALEGSLRRVGQASPRRPSRQRLLLLQYPRHRHRHRRVLVIGAVQRSRNVAALPLDPNRAALRTRPPGALFAPMSFPPAAALGPSQADAVVSAQQDPITTVTVFSGISLVTKETVTSFMTYLKRLPGGVLTPTEN